MKYTFLGNLIVNASCEFYNDNITVTLFIKIEYGDVAIEVIP